MNIKQDFIHFETLGCKLNQIESESAARAFSDQGFLCRMGGISSKSEKDTDVLLCLINTCTVTAKAEQKCRRIIRLLLEKYPHAAIVVTGCYAELEKAAISAIDNRIAVLGGQTKSVLAELPLIVKNWLNSPQKIQETSPLGIMLVQKLNLFFAKQDLERALLKPNSVKYDSFRLSTDTFLQHSRPSIKIQDGCNNRCTYCRICFARGASVSLEAQKILERVELLEKAGYSEVVLTGVNLSQYKSESYKLADLLDFLLFRTKKIAFRVSSLQPQSIDDELCTVFSHKRIRPHFHLSVQSGSDAVLLAMERPYKADQVDAAVKRLRSIKPNAFIACDIIAGFPAETEKDFSKTLDLCRRCNFTWIHAFPFSARPGTKALDFKPQLSPAKKTERVKKLTSLALEQKKAYIGTCIGKDFSALVEKRTGNTLRAVTENFLHIKLSLNGTESEAANLRGKQVQVRIDSINEAGLHNEECEASASLILC